MTPFPALLHPGPDGSITVSFPDLPGCIAVGDDAAEALRLAEDALALHLDGFTQAGERHPTPVALDRLLDQARAEGVAVGLVIARPGKAPAVRVNITLDKNLLADIDAAAAERGTTRSGFLAEGARRLLER
ncbi:MAG: ribbon-helix-helix protein, CopG family [Alphaproteobacteria bacterium]|nr:MAG: ribbon-helix-helix protein, CopG family [Alphaproteobacteria bacterium]